MTAKRPICSSCSNYLSSWGKTSSGKKRFRCKNCGITRIYHPNKNYTPDFFELFRQYILWGFTYKALSSLSNYSIQYLSFKFHEFLLEDPPKLPLVDQSGLDEAYLLIDGLWFGRWWYIHKGARKAARMLTSLPEISFTFLSHPTMPKTTNELEAQFGHLGRRWIAHTGLKEERWKDFLKWFVYFYNQEKMAVSNKKKDTKNNTTI